MIDELEKLLGTDAWLTLVLGAAFVAAFLVAVLLLSVGTKGRRRRSMANMMLGRGKDVAPETTWMPAGLAQAGTRLAQAGGFSSGLDLKLEQAGLPMKAGEFVALTAVCAVAGGVLGAFLLANIVVVLLVAAVGSLIPYVWLLRARSQRQKKMAEHIGSEDMRWAVMAVNIQRQVGGNLAEVLDIVANTVRERAYVHRQVRVLSAEGRISIGILSALPFGIFFYLMLVNPDYIGVLFTHPIGRILLIAGAALMGAGIFVMTRIVRVDV